MDRGELTETDDSYEIFIGGETIDLVVPSVACDFKRQLAFLV